MSSNYDMLKYMSKKQIYDMFLDYFNNFYERISYLEINKDDFKEITLKSVESTKIDDDFFTSLQENIYKSIIDLIRKDDNKMLLLINEYMQKNFNENFAENFNNFCSFLEKYNIKLRKSLVKKLLKKASFFKTVDDNIFNENFESNIFKNHNISLIFECYHDITMHESSEIFYAKETDALESYKAYLSKIKILTREEEIELATKIKEGDDTAREQLAVANLRLVYMFAARYAGRGIDLLDLVQEGNIGLMRAIDKFDPEMGYKFSTYASHSINTAIIGALKNKGRIIRNPVLFHDKIENYKRSYEKLLYELEREPTIEEIANEAKMSYEEACRVYYSLTPLISTNMKLTNDSDETLEEFITNDEESIQEKLEKKELSDVVMQALNNCNLTEVEIKVIMYRYGFYDSKIYTLEEIGEIFGLTRERVRQKEVAAIRKLRTSKYAKALAELTDTPEESKAKIKAYKTYYKKPGNRYKK